MRSLSFIWFDSSFCLLHNALNNGNKLALLAFTFLIAKRAIGLPHPMVGLDGVTGVREAHDSVAAKAALDAGHEIQAIPEKLNVASKERPVSRWMVDGQEPAPHDQEYEDELEAFHHQSTAKPTQLKVAGEFEGTKFHALQDANVAAKFRVSHDALRASEIAEKDKIIETATLAQKELSMLDRSLLAARADEMEVYAEHQLLNDNIRALTLEQRKKIKGSANSFYAVLGNVDTEITPQWIQDEWKLDLEKAEHDFLLEKQQPKGIKGMIAEGTDYLSRSEQRDEAMLQKALRVIRHTTRSRGAVWQEEIALELGRIRESGLRLAEEEQTLIKKIAQGDKAKFTTAEKALLETLSDPSNRVSVFSRREVQAEQLMTHFTYVKSVLSQQAHTSTTTRGIVFSDRGRVITRMGDPKKLEEMETMLKVLDFLHDKASRRLPYTHQDADLIRGFEEIAHKTTGNPLTFALSLSESQMNALAHISGLQREAEKMEMYRKALGMLEAEGANVGRNSEQLISKLRHKLSQDLHPSQQLETTPGGLKPEDLSLNDQEQNKIKSLATKHDLYKAKIPLHSNPNVIETAKITTGELLLSKEERALVVLKRHLKAEGKNIHPDRLALLERLVKLESMPRESLAHERRVLELSGYYHDKMWSLSELEKAERLKQLVVPGMQEELPDRAGFLNELRTTSHPTKDEAARITRAATYYNELLASMTDEEKALNYLKTKDRAALFTEPGDKDLVKQLQDRALSSQDRVRVNYYSEGYGLPTVEKRARDRLAMLKQNSPTSLTKEQNVLSIKLSKNGLVKLTAQEKKLVRELATESALIEDSKVPIDIQKSALSLISDIELGELETVDLEILKNLAPSELIELARLNKLSALDEEFKTESKFTKAMQLVKKAKDRSSVNLKKFDNEHFSNFVQLQKEIRQKEIEGVKSTVKTKEKNLEKLQDFLIGKSNQLRALREEPSKKWKWRARSA